MVTYFYDEKINNNTEKNIYIYTKKKVRTIFENIKKTNNK